MTVANSAEEGSPGPGSADERRSLGPSSEEASPGTMSAEDAAEAVDEMTQNNDEDDVGSGDNDSDWESVSGVMNVGIFSSVMLSIGAVYRSLLSFT